MLSVLPTSSWIARHRLSCGREETDVAILPSEMELLLCSSVPTKPPTQRYSPDYSHKTFSGPPYFSEAVFTTRSPRLAVFLVQHEVSFLSCGSRSRRNERKQLLMYYLQLHSTGEARRGNCEPAS